MEQGYDRYRATSRRMMRRIERHWQITIAASLIGLAIAAVGAFFYVRARDVLQEEIRERLRGIAAAAALQIDGDRIDRITGPQDMESADFSFIIEQLDRLRELPDIRFAYILRRTDDPMMLSFVADADLALTPMQLDRNGNGAVDPDEEAGYPGELYDITDIPALHQDAFAAPTVDRDVTVDQWGTLVSGYAPIRSFTSGEVVAVLGVDMRADVFSQSSHRIFSRFALVIVLLAGVFVAGFVMVTAEERQIGVLKKMNNERSGLLRLTFHQLGEPLTIMKWSLETLRDETENTQLKKLVDEHVACMDEGLGRLNSIIDTLQLAEKVDLNTLEYIPIESSIREIIDNAVGEWASAAETSKISIVQDVDDLRMPLDRTMISLVLRQLIVNAIEYSHEGGNVHIRASKNKHHLTVSISDSGCGIPRSEMPHLFEKYRRASNAHLKKPDGNGLGLYISKGIVERAGGTIWVESIEGRGTTVSFTLPVR